MSSQDYSSYQIKDVSGFSKMLFHLKWNTDGSYLASICGDRTVRVNSLEESSGNLSSIQTIPTQVLMTQVSWNPKNNSRLAICSDDKLVELWDVRAPKAASKITSLGNNINMSWSPCGDYLSLGNKSDVVCIMDLRNGSILKKKKFNYEVNELTWFNSNILLAATASEGYGSLDILSLTEEEFKLEQSIPAHAYTCVNLQLHREREKMFLSGLDNSLTIWDADSFLCERTLTFDSEIKHFSVSGDGQAIAVVTEDPSILLCNVDNGDPFLKITSRVKQTMLAWHPTKPLIASLCEDRSSSNPQYMKLTTLK